MNIENCNWHNIFNPSNSCYVKTQIKNVNRRSFLIPDFCSRYFNSWRELSINDYQEQNMVTIKIKSLF